MWRNDRRGTMIKENDGSGWSFDGVMLWLGRRQNEMQLSSEKSGQG
jgi:hypothetical protein